MNVKKLCAYALCLALVASMGAGCKHKKKPVFSPSTSGASTRGSETTTGSGEPNVDLSNLLFEPGSKYGLQTVYFDFDSSTLRPDAIATLASNAEKIKQVPNVIIQIAGNCDERGTQEYNLALGERRAQAVRSHLISLGVSGDRMITISYGEEMPAVQGHDEGAWSKNRRAEFNRAQAR